jgi:hypothetical protein
MGVSAGQVRSKDCVAKLIVMKKGGGGRVAINPEQVTHVRSATGAFTDVFFDGHQVAVEGTFEEVVALLSDQNRRLPQAPGDQSEGQRGLAFGRFDRGL